jgi:hypothetical protein
LQPNFGGIVLGWIFYQNMPNLHNRYISAERKISQKNPEYLLKFELILTYTKAAMDNKNFIPPFFYLTLGGVQDRKI